MRVWQGREQEIAENIKAILKRKKLSQKELATRMQVSPVTINRILKGSGNCLLSTLFKIADALEVRPSDLIDGGESAVGKTERGVLVLLQAYLMLRRNGLQSDAAKIMDRIAEKMDTLP